VGICKSRYLKKNIELLTSTPPIIKKTTTSTHRVVAVTKKNSGVE
jgi:hypothetical protein